MSKRSSTIRRENYEKLLSAFREKDNMYQLSNVRTYKGIQNFCVYLANYTSITCIEEIDSEIIERFLKYFVENKKRLNMNLSDMKKTIIAIQELTEVSSCDYLFDFSVSNVALWSNLK